MTPSPRKRTGRVQPEGRVRETAIENTRSMVARIAGNLRLVGCDEDSCSPEGDAGSSLQLFRYQLGNLPGAYALIFSMGASSVPFEAAVRIYSRRSRPIPSRLSPSYPLYCFHRRSALDFRAGASLRSCASHPVEDVANEGEDTTPTASQHRADTAEGSGHAATQMNAARANPAAIPVAQANAAMKQVQRSSSAIENRFVIPILPAKAVTSLAIKGLPQPNEQRQPPITRPLLSTRAS